MCQKEKSLKMITSNHHKFNEAKHILSEFGIQLVRVDVRRVEIQAENVEEIARYSIETAAASIGGPAITEDAGLSIRHLNGFPGPYSSYVLSKIGLQGILRLMEGISDREAHFMSAIAFCESTSKPVRVFNAIAEGTISRETRGTHGFGYDPIFIPSEGDGRTFAEMKLEEKNQLSHRAKALKEFGRWFMGE